MAITPKISYCLWFNQNAQEVAAFYTHVFHSRSPSQIQHNPVDTPSGKKGSVLTASFAIEGQQFMALNGGAQFKVNPSVSFMVHCETKARVEELWAMLSREGKVIMPLDSYPFSAKYGWVEDRYGLSWQLILAQNEAPQKVMPVLMFVNKVCGKAREAIGYYTGIFHESKTGTLAPYPEGMEPDQAGALMYADFMLEGQWFAAMDSARMHDFDFNDAISFMVHCHTQQEIDYYWDKLTAEGTEVQCGWLRDKYGVAWQIVPTVLPRLLQNDDKEKSKRVMKALMSMVKLDITQLEEA